MYSRPVESLMSAPWPDTQMRVAAYADGWWSGCIRWAWSVPRSAWVVMDVHATRRWQGGIPGPQMAQIQGPQM